MSIDNRYRKRIRGNRNWKHISVDKYPRRIRVDKYPKPIKLIDFGGISMLIYLESYQVDRMESYQVDRMESYQVNRNWRRIRVDNIQNLSS